MTPEQQAALDYTTPPGGRQSEDCLSNVATPLAAQPALKPLTEPALRAVLTKTNHMITNTMHGPFWPELEQACRAIEAAHGITGETK